VTTPPLNTEHTQQVTSPLARSRPAWQDLPAAIWRARSVALFGYELTCVWLPDDEIRARQQSQRAHQEWAVSTEE
jgi:hypothetical protein